MRFGTPDLAGVDVSVVVGIEIDDARDLTGARLPADRRAARNARRSIADNAVSEMRRVSASAGAAVGTGGVNGDSTTSGVHEPVRLS